MTDEQAVRIARDVLGWTKWDELPIIARMAYLAILPRKPDPFRLARLRKSWWSVSNECAYIKLFFAFDWQPHKDVVQALLVRDEIVKRGWCFSVHIDPRDVSPQGKVVVAFYRPVPYTAFRARATTDAKAICLAADKWLGAQGLPDSG